MCFGWMKLNLDGLDKEVRIMCSENLEKPENNNPQRKRCVSIWPIMDGFVAQGKQVENRKWFCLTGWRMNEKIKPSKTLGGTPYSWAKRVKQVLSIKQNLWQGSWIGMKEKIQNSQFCWKCEEGIRTYRALWKKKHKVHLNLARNTGQIRNEFWKGYM